MDDLQFLSKLQRAHAEYVMIDWIPVEATRAPPVLPTNGATSDDAGRTSPPDERRGLTLISQYSPFPLCLALKK